MTDFDDAVAGLRAQRPQFTDPRIKVTGYRFPDGTVSNDPTEGAQSGYLWVYGYPRPGANTQVIAGTRVNPRVPNVKVWVGQNHAKQAVAFDVVTDENAIRQFGGAVGAASTPLIPIEQWTQPVPGSLIGGGRLLPSALGGLNVFIEGLVGFGWDGNDLPIDAGDIPPNPNEHGWAVWYLPPYSGTPVVPEYLLTTPVTVSSVNFLLVSDAYNLVLPAGATRLAAVSLSYGQITISGANSRFVDLRRDFVPEGVNDAADVNYTPAVPGDWSSPPTEVAEALDALAAGAVAGAGAQILIYDLTLGSAGQFDTNTADDSGRTGISQSYTDLIFIVEGAGVTQQGVEIFLNNDTTTGNYAGLRSVDSAAGGGGQVNEIGFVDASGGYAGCKSELLAYSKTTAKARIYSRSVWGTAPTLYEYWTAYNQTGAITRISLHLRLNTNFETGSRFRVFGVV